MPALRPRTALRAIVLITLGAVAVPAHARDGGPGPQRPLWPKPGRTDAMLFEKAMTLQAQMWHHISPEGLLVYRHPRGAGAAALSNESIDRADAAIWTGCYAAAQACRWHVTGDADALAQVRALAQGLVNLSRVTGVPGRLARNVGVPLKTPVVPGQFEGPVRPSPAVEGWWSRTDVSRDQLAGVVLGWALIARYVKEPEIQAQAKQQMKQIALRLDADGMWLRDERGSKTEYGELRKDVKYLPMRKNGSYAAIGLAPIIVAADLNRDTPFLQHLVERYDKHGWDDALVEQNTQLRELVNSSNVNMTALALLCIALGERPKEAGRARAGMWQLRRATVGWWNAGICACWLLGGLERDRARLLGEIRSTLHRMPDRERPRTLVRQFKRYAVAPIDQRQPSAWHWTNNVRHFHIWKPGGELPDEVMYTGADWLFAYWLTRAAGALTPRTGPGARRETSRCEVDYPPWMRPR